mmetsp:Transcript_21513/g.54195  ORF Transcript_21513/g.54195 Transcript_21513/m.54195 type:complete len:212 (-) Transcript_21513:846-1481(-)
MGFKFQVKLSGHWNNYSDEENAFLTRAYMSGLKGCKYLLRGNHYEYNFNTMEQVNLQSGKRRQIRAPPNLRPPAQPVVKPGPTVCVVVPPNAKGGDVLHVPHPQNKSVMMQVNVPMGAAPGATLLVPVPPLAIANHQKKKNRAAAASHRKRTGCCRSSCSASSCRRRLEVTGGCWPEPRKRSCNRSRRGCRGSRRSGSGRRGGNDGSRWST